MTVHFRTFPFYSLFLITYVANICWWYILYFYFFLASKKAKCDNKEQEAAFRGKKKDMRREYSSGKFSVISGWETKETSCFLTEIFPFKVNLETPKLNHAKAGNIW